MKFKKNIENNVALMIFFSFFSIEISLFLFLNIRIYSLCINIKMADKNGMNKLIKGNGAENK